MKKFTVKTRRSQYAYAFKTLPRYLELMNSMRDNDEVFEKARTIFFQEHPEVPRPEIIRELDLVIDKADALDVLNEKRRVVYAPYEDLTDELYDQKVLDFEEAHWDDPLMKQMLLDFTDSVRGVMKLHLHDESNTWYLDILCEENNTVMVKNDQIMDLQERYGFHDLDDELAKHNSLGTEDGNRPIYFYFALTKVQKTNL